MNRYGLTLDGLFVRYYEAGEGPALIFLHGAGATARLWHRQAGYFASGFRVVMPDLPGFGGSEYSPEIRRVRDYSGFIAGFLDALGAERTSIVASSMGGWAACWFAILHPGRVDRLVLISPAGLYIPQEPPMSVGQVVEEIRKLYSGYLDAAGTAGAGPAEDLKRGVETIGRLSVTGGFLPDLSGRLKEIPAPTLIIWGEEDRVVPVSYAEAFRRGIPGSVLRVIPGAGHLPFTERADEVNGIIAEFLDLRGAWKGRQ